MEDMTEIMVDIETMSTRSNAAIVSIGAVRIMPPSLATLGTVTTDTFYINIDLASCQDEGLHVESRTVSWWSQQSEAAREALKRDPVSLKNGLAAFSAWFGQNTKPVWANPATFDLTILDNAYRTVGHLPPFEFYDVRCYMTLKRLFPELKYSPPMVAHNALQDAVAQAEHLIKMLRLIQQAKEPKNVDNA